MITADLIGGPCDGDTVHVRLPPPERLLMPVQSGNPAAVVAAQWLPGTFTIGVYVLTARGYDATGANVAVRYEWRPTNPPPAGPRPQPTTVELEQLTKAMRHHPDL